MKNKTTPKMAHIFLQLHIMDNIAKPGTAKNEYLVKQIARNGLNLAVSRGTITIQQAETFISELASKTDKALGV